MRLLLLLLLASVPVTFALAAEEKRAVAEQSEALPLEELLQLYREFGLPLPPSDAPLVRISTGWLSLMASGKMEPTFTLGFLLKPAQGKAPPEVLAGAWLSQKEYASKDGPPIAVDPANVRVEDLCFTGLSEPFPMDGTLSTAIQCHARGYKDLAAALFAKSLVVEGYQGPTAVRGNGPWMAHRQPAAFRAEPGDDAITLLGGTAWTYWLIEAMRPGSDRAAVVLMMRKIFEKAPALADAARRALLGDLEAALVPSASALGSVESEIDSLVESSESFGNFIGNDREAPYRKLILRGFEAVPALIEHLDDARLSRSTMAGLNNFPTMPRRVGEIVADLLQDLAGEDLSRDFVQRQLGVSVKKEAPLKWWKEAKKLGEKKYVRRHVLPKKKGAETPNIALLRIVEASYPAMLPELYTEVLGQRPRMQSSDLADAIARSALSRDEKLRLFRRAESHPLLSHRMAAIEEHQKLEPGIADEALLKIVENLPRQVRGEVWLSPEAGVSLLVTDSASPMVWGALLTAAKRAHISLRMELIHHVRSMDLGDQQRIQALKFHAAFLDDDAVRDTADNKRLYAGPCAAFTFKRISVHDFAAMQIGLLLEHPVQPDPAWTAQQWEGFRSVIVDALRHALE